MGDIERINDEFVRRKEPRTKRCVRKSREFPRGLRVRGSFVDHAHIHTLFRRVALPYRCRFVCVLSLAAFINNLNASEEGSVLRALELVLPSLP